MLYCNIEQSPTAPFMSHHHHHPGRVHPSAALRPSLLRVSAAWRLVVAGLLIVLIWTATFWAMG